jgi:dTDP-4-amino-4,6-dideoxygalactose transaminase
MKTEYSNRALNLLYLFVINNGLRKTPIILPTNICHDVYFLLKFLGNELIFLDINSETLEMDTVDAIESIKTQSKVILLWNHTYGNEEVPYAFFNEAKNINPDLIIIDDRCLCNPALVQLTKEDGIIDMILFSTGAKKQIDLGFGAFGFLNEDYTISDLHHDFDMAVYQRLKSSFKDGDKDRLGKEIVLSWTERAGIKLDNAGYWNQIKSEHISWDKHKNNIREIYSAEIGQEFNIADRFNGWRFNILVRNKTELIRLLRGEDLFLSDHYPSIGSVLNGASFPNAEKLYEHVLNLFIDKYYTAEMAYKTAKIIHDHGHPI